MHPSALIPAPAKPLLRGVSHQVFFFVALAAGLALVLAAPSPHAAAAAAVYGVSLATLLGVSALYHRINWPPRPRIWMRRLDHSAIFILIAGTYTPFCMALPERSTLALAVIWGCALAGTIKSLLFPYAPKWVVAALCVAMGWGGVLMVPTIAARAGVLGAGLLLAGGVLYSAGAAIYALKRPDPLPRTFGYHEVFHALVVAAAMLHFVVVARVVAGL